MYIKTDFIRKTLIYILLLVLLSFICSGLYLWALFTPNSLDQDKVVIIHKGTSLNEIATKLKQNGVINSPIFFQVSIVLTGKKSLIKAGEYNFLPHTNLAQVIDILVSGKVVVHKITIPEGLTTKQIIKILEQQDLLHGEIINTYKEGFLLPSTYYYVYGDRKQNILDRMNKLFMEKITPIWQNRQDNLPIKTLDEAIILASIVEEETSMPEERKRIASVFINRLAKGMPLQADPTVIYAVTDGLGELNRTLNKKDLKIDSPYNTYLYKGLPPTAISNPGQNTIYATLNPLSTKELFFVTTGTGGHNFSSNLKEHNEYVRKYRDLIKTKKADN
jgi:UPF0755 protein